MNGVFPKKGGKELSEPLQWTKTNRDEAFGLCNDGKI